MITDIHTVDIRMVQKLDIRILMDKTSWPMLRKDTRIHTTRLKLSPMRVDMSQMGFHRTKSMASRLTVISRDRTETPEKCRSLRLSQALLPSGELQVRDANTVDHDRGYCPHWMIFLFTQRLSGMKSLRPVDWMMWSRFQAPIRMLMVRRLLPRMLQENKRLYCRNHQVTIATEREIRLSTALCTILTTTRNQKSLARADTATLMAI